MKRRTKLLVFVPLGVFAALLLGGYVYLRLFFNPFSPGPVKGVDPAAWTKLAPGMTKEQVVALLGDAPCKSGTITITSEDGTEQFSPPEYWHYTWSNGIDFLGPPGQAHVVWFDGKGRVVSFRAPVPPEPAGKGPP